MDFVSLTPVCESTIFLCCAFEDNKMFPKCSRAKSSAQSNSKNKLANSNSTGKHQIRNSEFSPTNDSEWNTSTWNSDGVDYCDERCLLFKCTSARHKENAHLTKKNYDPYGRHSLDPRYTTNYRKLSKTSSEQLCKQSPMRKPRMSLRCKSNQAKTPSPQISNIPKLKKKLTEPSGPSLLDRPRKPHNCYPTTPEDAISRTFDRYCTQRQPVKQLSKTPTGGSSGGKCHLANRNRMLNVSYTILPKISKKFKRLGEPVGPTGKPASLSKQTELKTIHNVTDDMKNGKSEEEVLNLSANFHVQHSSSPIKRRDSEEKLITELSLSTHNLRSSQYYNIAYSGDALSKSGDDLLLAIPEAPAMGGDSQKNLRCLSMSELNDCNVVLLLQDQFIDESYDTYMKALNQAVETLQVSQTDTLIQMTEHMARTVLKNESDVKLEVLQKIQQHLCKAKQQAGWSDLEGIVNSAISQLKEDFEKKIFQVTNLKLTSLVAELKTTMSSANNDIETSCNDAVKNLIAQLKKNSLKRSVP